MGSFWSRVRESNPPPRLGKPLYYRCTNPAYLLFIILCARPYFNASFYTVFSVRRTGRTEETEIQRVPSVSGTRLLSYSAPPPFFFFEEPSMDTASTAIRNADIIHFSFFMILILLPFLLFSAMHAVLYRPCAAGKSVRTPAETCPAGH